MKKILKNMNWGELFFPVIEDLKSINKETDTTKISSNNWELANDNNHFEEVIEKIKKSRSEENKQHNIIVI